MVLHNAAVTGSLTVNGVDVSSITGSSTYSASFASQIASLNATTASLNSYTSSATARFIGLETATASLNSYTSSNTANITSLNNYTSSATARFIGLETATASFSGRVSGLEAATASLNSYTSSNTANITSLNSYTSSATNRFVGLEAATASLNSYTSSATARFVGLEAATASLYTATASFSGRVVGLEAATSSLNTFTSSIAGRVTVVESKYATTGSNIFIGTQTITGSLLQSGSFTSTGTITAQTLVVQTITSSVVYSSGSNKFGNAIGNTQTFTGSVLVTGSLTIAGGSSATSYSGATIYGSTAVCSPVGLFSGCVGIGITSPSANLDINATGGLGGWTGIRLKTGTSSVQSLSIGQVTAGNGAFIGMAQYNQGGYWQTEGTAAAVLNFESDGTFRISTNSGLTANTNYNITERLRITSDGISCFACQICSPSFIGGTLSGTTIYGSTAVCSAVGKFTSCVDAGSGTFSSSVTATGQIIANANNGAISISGTGYTTNPTNMLIGRYTSTRGYIQVPTNGTLEIWNGGTSEIATFNETGKTTTLYGTLSGTSAAFSSTITGTTIYGSTAVCSPVGLFSGCIGIGTATPSSALQIFRTAYTGNQFKTYAELQAAPTTLCYTTSDGFGLILNMYEAISGAPYTRYADIVANTGDISNSAMRFFTKAASVNATEKMRITPEGDVGIGTAGGTYGKFTVDSSNQSYAIVALANDQTSARIRIKNTGTSGGDYAWIAGVNNVGNAGFSLLDITNSATKLTIDSTGVTTFACQICTTALITADLRYTGTGYITYDTSASGTSCLIFRQNATERMRISECGYVAVTGNQALSCVPYLQGMSFGWNRSNGQGESMINWTNAGGGSTCDLVFNFRDSSTLYERLRIASTGAACFACTITANGGVITSAGTNAFIDINGSTLGTLAGIRLYSDGSTKWIISHSTPSTYRFSIGTATGLTTFSEKFGIDYSTGASTFSSTITGTTIYGSTAVCSPVGLFSGCVGIGMTTPDQKLVVQAGNIKLYSVQNVADDYRFIGTEYSSGNGNNKAEIRFAIDGSDTNTRLTFHTAAGGGTCTERMRITSGGYLLLGTTTSTYGQGGRGNFEMQGSTDNIFVQKVAGSLANYLYSDATKSELYSTNFLQVSVNGAERMRITSGGNVGIGTTTPISSLMVSKTLASNQTYLTLDNKTNSKYNWGIDWAVLDSTNVPVAAIRAIYPADNDVSLGFYTYNLAGNVAERMRITTGGNVGIGDTSPAYLLHVGGGDIGTSGNVNVRYTSNETYKGTLGWNHLQLGNNGQNDIVAGRTVAGGYFRFIVNNTSNYTYNSYDGTVAMVIAAGGNVGIGTTSACSTLDVRGTITNGSTAGSNSTIDVSPAKQSIANGGYVDFPNMSGMIVVNDWTDGTITIFLAGGGSTSPIGSAAGQAGALYYNSGVAGYRWCNINKGYTGNFGFLVFKTRNTA